MTYRQQVTKEIHILLRLHDKLPDGCEERRVLQRKVLFLMDAVKTAEFEEGLV